MTINCTSNSPNAEATRAKQVMNKSMAVSRMWSTSPRLGCVGPWLLYVCLVCLTLRSECSVLQVLVVNRCDRAEKRTSGDKPLKCLGEKSNTHAWLCVHLSCTQGWWLFTIHIHVQTLLIIWSCICMMACGIYVTSFSWDVWQLGYGQLLCAPVLTEKRHRKHSIYCKSESQVVFIVGYEKVT